MKSEAEALLQALDLRKQNQPFRSGVPFEFYQSDFATGQLALLVSGTDPDFHVDNVATVPAALMSYLAIVHFNPDMVLYFIKNYLRTGQFPERMIDNNIASDYGKIKNLFQLKNPDQNYQALETLLKEGEISATLTTQYSFEIDFSLDDFISLLFFMGLVTIKEDYFDMLKFQFPNRVIKGLYEKDADGRVSMRQPLFPGLKIVLALVLFFETNTRGC